MTSQTSSTLCQRLGAALKWLGANRISPAAFEELTKTLGGGAAVRELELGRRGCGLVELVDKILPAYERALRVTAGSEEVFSLRDLLALADVLPHERRAQILAGPKRAHSLRQAKRLDADRVTYYSYLLDRALGHTEVALSRVILNPGARAGGPFFHRHFGQEMLLLLRGGPIDMFVERPEGGDPERFTLHANECLTFFSHRPHWVENRSKRQAHYLVIRCPAHTPDLTDRPGGR